MLKDGDQVIIHETGRAGSGKWTGALCGFRSCCQESEPSLTAYSGANTFTIISPDKDTCAHVHICACVLFLLYNPRRFHLSLPLCQVLPVLFFYFYLFSLLPPPRRDCLGILNPYKEQTSHPIESSFLFKPRMRTVSIKVVLNPSVVLKIRPWWQ